MKTYFTVAAFLLISHVAISQTITLKKDNNFLPDPNLDLSILSQPYDLKIKFTSIHEANLIGLLKQDTIRYSDGSARSFYDIAKLNIGSQGNENEDNKKLNQLIKDSVSIMDFTQELNSRAVIDSLELVFHDDTNQNIHSIKLKPKSQDDSVTNNSQLPVPTIIDDAMIAGVASNGCQLCDMNNNQLSESIKNRHDRQFSTDYIINYDPLLENDAYTICKHIFEKRNGKLYERYRKVAPGWFAPRVGSQIRFEVVNQSLTNSFKLQVDEKDVFNAGASQFANLISGLVNTNIMHPLLADTSTHEQMSETNNLPAKLQNILPQIARYMAAFRVSSCSIRQFRSDLPQIIQRMNNYLGLNAVTPDQMYTGLKNNISMMEDGDAKTTALKSADNLIAALDMLDKLKPTAYTTIRAKNRDLIEIKYIDSSRTESKPENIRMSGGMKIDFSAGFVLTGLRDYTYTLKNVVVPYTPPGTDGTQRDTTGNVIVRENDGNNQVGVGIFSHFYPRISSHYNISGTIGLMTSTDLNLRMMMGGSLLISSLFGSDNRISFTYGLVWGKVNRLSNQSTDFLDAPRMINGLPEFYAGPSAPSVISKSEHSWFFAITMNFGGR